jgi:hypothetical protein
LPAPTPQVAADAVVAWPGGSLWGRIRRSTASAPLFQVLYSNEFKRAIDSAILRCSSTNPAFRNTIAPEFITRRLQLLQPLREYIDRETSDLQIPDKIE